jgi:hypothetical protein
MGVPGLEATHTWNNGVVLNNRGTSPATRPDPCYKLDRIGGLKSLADPEDQRDAGTGRAGEIERLSVRRGKTLTYEGMIQSRSLAGLRTAESTMTAAFYEMAAGVMLMQPLPGAAWPTRQFHARCLTLDIPDEQVVPYTRWSRGYERPFALGLRMSDARFYDPTTNLALQTAAITQLSGLAPPFTPPFTLTAPAAGAGSVTFDNPGTAPVDPVIDIYGPVTNPIIENTSMGKDLRFSASGGLIIPAGQFLRVDFVSRRVLLQGTTDYRAKLDLITSSWWDPNVWGLAAGSNTIRLRGDSVADPAKAIITFNPADWA